MKKNIVLLCIVFALVAMIVVPASAIVNPPAKSNGKTFEDIWNAIMDLQNQITSLTNQGTCKNCNCPSGQFVTGFDANGALLCGSPPISDPNIISCQRQRDSNGFWACSVLCPSGYGVQESKFWTTNTPNQAPVFIYVYQYPENYGFTCEGTAAGLCGATCVSPPPLPTRTPIISDVIPTDGTINDVLTLQINGQNFNEGVKVSLIKDSKEIVCTSPVSTDSTKIVCNLDLSISKGAEVGDWDVTVLNIDGQQKGTWNQKFRIFDSKPPTFKKIDPDYGTVGTTILITALTGTNFQSGATVKLMKLDNPNITATNVNLQSPTLITCTFSPPANAAAGAWDVVITNPDGQFVRYSNIFSLKGSTTPPDSASISSVSPTFTYGNDVQMTIIGTNLQSGNINVKLTKSTNTNIEILARNVRWDSATQVTAWFTIPGNSIGIWNVVMTNPDGSTCTLPDGFEVKTQP
jgi:hypothetical protein